MTRPLAQRNPAARWLTAALLPLALGGCDALTPDTRDPGVTPDQFVDVVVALRQAEQEVGGEADADSVQMEFTRRRDLILEEHGVTADEIRAFVLRHQDRPALLAEAWERVAERLGSNTSNAADGRFPDEEAW